MKTGGPWTLRSRMLGAFALFALVLAIVMIGSFHTVFHFSEDLVVRRQLQVEAEHLMSHPDLLQQRRIDLGRYITAYVGSEAVPENLRDSLSPLEPGVYEFGDYGDIVENHRDQEIHVLVRVLDGQSELLYLVFDGTSIGAVCWMGAVYLMAIAVSLLMVCLVGLAVGRILADLVIRPVTTLGNEVRSGPLEDLADRVDPDCYRGEVGDLARVLAEAAERLKGFVAREREFTANASHELRTPITVIRGATELIEAQAGVGDIPALDRPLARVRRAVASMEETIEVFLALARENELALPSEGCRVAETVAEVVAQHRRILADKPVGVVVRVPSDLRVEAPPRVLEIVLGNLVNNAFRRTLRGSVTISWHENRIEVADTGPGIPHHVLERAGDRYVSCDTEHGIGLSIVKTLCERFGWRLRIESEEGSGTRVSLALR